MKQPWLQRLRATPSNVAVFTAACAMLLLATPGADAKGGRRGGASSGSHHGTTESSGGTTINLRSTQSSTSPSSSNDSSANTAPASSPGFRSGSNAAPSREAATAVDTRPLTPEEANRKAALLVEYEKEQNQALADQKSAAERRETARLADKKAADQLANRKNAEERAAASRATAEQDRRNRDDAAINAEADQVLQRAMADYPLLRTAEGQVVLHQIRERQKALQAKGVYPSVAMVEAVADHAFALAPKTKPLQDVAPAPVAPKAIGGCRWITPTQWGCS